MKTQADISSELTKLIPTLNKDIITNIKKNPLLSTTAANLKRINPKTLLQQGFSDLEIETEEGFKNRVLVRFLDIEAPLVVFIAGTGLSVDMQAFEDFVIPFYKDAPWHIALVESSSSGDWIKRNSHRKRLIVSGYEAGWNLYLLLKKFRSIYDHRPIKNINIMGLSLGGSDTAFCCYFDSILKTNIINGAAIAFCSPADRLTGLNDFRKMEGILFRSFYVALSFDIYRKSRSVFRAYSDKPFTWGINKNLSTEDFLTEYYLRSTVEYFKEFSHHFDKNPKKIFLENESVQTFNDLAELFSLKPYIKKIETPFLWINTLDDPVVKTETVSNFFKNNQIPEKMSFITAEYGGHLGFAQIYSSSWLYKFIETYVNYWL